MSARQIGYGKLAGMIDDIIFKEGKSAYKRGRSVSAGIKDKSDPRFARTRENISEFARAGNAGRLIRDAIRQHIKIMRDRKAVGSLFSLLNTVIKRDPINDRGSRTVADGPLEMLEGFDLSTSAQLKLILPLQINTVADHVGGLFTVNIPEFTPVRVMNIPPGATHFRFTAIAMELDFRQDTYVTKAMSTLNLPWDTQERPPLAMTLTLTPNSTKPVFVVLAIEYDQLVNQKYYPITSADFNAVRIMKVSTP